jgi:hypothetical protein
MNLSDGWAVDHKGVRGGGTVPTILIALTITSYNNLILPQLCKVWDARDPQRESDRSGARADSNSYNSPVAQ